MPTGRSRLVALASALFDIIAINQEISSILS